MASSTQQTPALPNLSNSADSSSVGSLEGLSPNFDRACLGIPAEDDEFTRGLTFLFDPSTGQPSVHSTSQESDYPDELPRYEPSRSSENTSSHKVLTPQSVSDASGGLHPRLVSSTSAASSDGGFDGLYPPSVSARASAGTSNAASSTKLNQTPSQLSMAGIYTTTTMPSAIDPPLLETFGPPEDITDPRSIIHVTPSDVRCLEEIMSLEKPDRLVGPEQASDPMDLDDNPISQSATSPHPEHAQRLRPNREELHQRTSPDTTAVVTRTPRVSRQARHPAGQRVPTKEAIEKTRLMRKMGVCLPCLVNHEQCGPEEICPKCMKGLSSLKIQKTPCVRQKLSTAVLFRKGALSFPDGPPEIREWVSRRNVSLLLYNVGPASTSVPPESRPRFMVRCREFPNTLGIRSVKSWTKGSYKIDIHLPNFAMTRTQCAEAGKNLDELIKAEYNKLLNELAIGEAEDIVSLTLAEAVRQAENCWTIKGALKLSVLSRLASKSFNIFGDETLGIRPEEDAQCPYYGRTPIPPLLDAQIDFLLMEKMKDLKKSVLSGLRRMIAGQGRKHWFKIYLTILVLLLNLESVYQNQARQIDRYREPTFHQQTMLESWEKAAQNLLDHFRAVCRGHIPLNMVWSRADQDAAEVDDESLGFIDHLKELVRSRDEDLRKHLTASAGTPLVWIAALFEP